MRILHTYIPTDNGAPLDRSHYYCMALSALLAKRHYGHIELYTNNKIKKSVEEIGIPYDVINTQLLNNTTFETFSIPKMMVYASQIEPYVHIDLDTFIYDKVDFKDEETTYSTFAEGNMMHLSFLKANRQFYNTYIVNAFKLQDKLPNDFLEHVKFNYIPNMSIFGGYKHELVAEASKYCLEIYYNNQEFFDKDFYNACIAEQLFIPAAMRMIQGGEVPPLFTFLFNGNPTYFKFVNESEKRDFPFEIVSENRLTYINDETDLFKNIMNNFNGVLHLNGYKDFEKAIFLIRQRIITDFNREDIVNKIDEMFNDYIESDDITYSYCEYLCNQINKL